MIWFYVSLKFFEFKVSTSSTSKVVTIKHYINSTNFY